MNIRELIEELQQYDPELDVMIPHEYDSHTGHTYQNLDGLQEGVHTERDFSKKYNDPGRFVYRNVVFLW